MSHTRGYFILFAILSSVLSSVATIFKVQGVRLIPPLLAAPVGVLFAGLIMWSYLIFKKQLPSLKKVREVESDLLKLTLCRPVFANILFSVGISMSSAVEAVFLTKMEPYLVIFWVWLLDHKRPSSKHLTLLIIHIIGAFMLSAGDKQVGNSLYWLGDFIIILGVVAAGLSYRYAPKVSKSLNPLHIAAISETAGGILTLPIALLFCPLAFGQEYLVGWGYIAIHSIMFYVFSITLLYASLKGIEGWLSSALRATGPLVAAPISILFFGEHLNQIQAAGALIVLITSAMISKADKKAEIKLPSAAV